jgi:TM2 domain-containing membrane protein YozV
LPTLSVVRLGLVAIEGDRSRTRIGHADRVVLVIPERGTRTRSMEAQLEQRLGYPGALVVNNTGARSPIVSLLFGGDRTLGKVVYFSRDGRPHVQAITYARNIRASFAMLLRPFSVYSAPLESAFATVFTALDLAWTPAGPSRAIAIALAATVGIFGLHHLYLGDRRRAVKYLIFFWTIVPMALAIRDAIRLVLIDQAEFERAYWPGTAPAAVVRSP